VVPVNAGFSSGSGGSLDAGTYYYQITATNVFGETTPSTETSITVTGSGNQVYVIANGMLNAAGCDVYGRSTGAEGFLAAGTIVGGQCVYTDTGAATPGSAPPGTNTTAGFMANGVPLSPAGGTPTQVQYNNGGVLGGIPGSAVTSGGSVTLFGTDTNGFLVSMNGPIILSDTSSPADELYLNGGTASLEDVAGDAATLNSGVVQINDYTHDQLYLGGGEASITGSAGGDEFYTNTGVALMADGIGDQLVLTGGKSTFGSPVSPGIEVLGWAIGMIIFTGSGLNDVATGGFMKSTTAITICMVIDGTAPDTFKWGDDNCSTFPHTGVLFTGALQPLEYGIMVSGAVIGHTLADQWTFPVAAAPGDGYFFACADCDTPTAEGATCTNTGDHAGADAHYRRGDIKCD